MQLTKKQLIECCQAALNEYKDKKFFKDNNCKYIEVFDRTERFNDEYTEGHSRGSSIAIICAENLAFRFPKKDITCVPFSSPRAGNGYFVESFNQKVKNCYRIWLGDDTVVRVPPWLFGYRHTKGGKKLMKNYLLPWNWITFILSYPWDHFVHRVLYEMKKQL